MRGATGPHAPFRDLLATRLDRPLTRVELRTLNAHLKKCATCQAADAEYHAQRNMLRALPQPLPPRDLWARTSAALDREVAHSVRGPWSRGLRTLRRNARPATGLVTALATMGVVTALTVLQISPAVPPATAAPVRPTPFAVNPETLAFVGLGPSDIAIYRTVVRQVCPASAPLDCVATERIERSSVAGSLPYMHTGNIALSPTGKELALVGRNVDSDVIAVVMMPGAGASGAPLIPTESVDIVEPTGNPGEPTVKPTEDTPTDAPPTDPPATPAGEPTLPPSEPPAPTEPALPTATPTAADTPAATQTPATEEPTPAASTEPPATTEPVRTLDPTQGPITPAPVTDAPATPEPTTPEPASEPPATPTAEPARTDAPPTGTASARPGLRIVNILENVRAAGSPPAWSRNGELLAFSAMPVDGSHGPDIYVWAPGDTAARPVTTDHRSYFASWSGNRIVISRVALADDGAVEPRTFVLDPRSLEERAVAGPAMWLPSVSTDRSRAVVWSGELAVDDGLTAPLSGALYVVDWTLIDPFRPSAPEDSDESQATDASDPEVTLLPLEPDRDPRGAPVVDWNARWSPDSRVLGVWIADTVGSAWGRLTVLPLDPETQRVMRNDPLLETTLARRGFSLSDDRVAWVAPSDENVDGELRIRAWTEDGVGGLRVVAPDTEEVLPAL